jgi:RNA polymerase sigma-70 factor (ECF subfamily)
MAAVRTETQPSFEDFHQTRSGAALRYARTIVGRDGAEDACQEAWLRAWRAWGTADLARLDAWLRAIVRNCCLDSISRRNATRPVDEGDLPLASAAEDLALSGIDLAVLRAHLLRLPQPLRDALWLREIGDLSYAEIASHQHIPLGTVMSRLHAARSRARRLPIAG